MLSLVAVKMFTVLFNWETRLPKLRLELLLLCCSSVEESIICWVLRITFPESFCYVIISQCFNSRQSISVETSNEELNAMHVPQRIWLVTVIKCRWVLLCSKAGCTLGNLLAAGSEDHLCIQFSLCCTLFLASSTYTIKLYLRFDWNMEKVRGWGW